MLEVKQFPKDMSVFEVDRADAKQCFLFGLFEETVKLENGTRSFYTYLKPGLHYNQPCLVVAPPASESVLTWLEESFWLSFAEDHDLFLHILKPENGAWDEGGADADYMNKVYMQIQSRQAYVTMQDNIYALGLGDGAVIAQQAVMKMSSEWSGLASFGELSAAAMRNANVLHGSESTVKTELSINAAKVQVPVWMGWQENAGDNAAVCDYWKKQNDADGERFSNAFADEIYFPSTVCKSSQLNEEKISQVRVTNGFAGGMGRELADSVWNFLSKACRHRGFGHKMLRNRIDPKAYGFEEHTMEHGGFTRLWLEYVPASVRESGKKVPLVLCMHGRGGTADSFLSLSGLSRVAEERNFIAVFPEAGVYQQRPGGVRNTLLWNGEYEGERIDDVGFLLKVVEDVKARYAIDAARVYACGQSSGGMMSAALAEKAPDVFAAVSPWSAIVDPDHDLVLPEKIDPAVPFMFLFGDRDWLVADRENGEMEFGVVSSVAAYLRNLIRLYGLEEKPLQYVCGEISWFVYRNANKVPMLTVGRVAGMTHANYPRESWIAYDEFLCRFSKAADGTLYYMAEKV
ncbi:MAG: prolyl oligopeptidase family serine peptidase [Lachnospiraceae bacterium]|nr:prolyl oligopeptidase family serine peptidase [Lachnospiraceae bacterium]